MALGVETYKIGSKWSIDILFTDDQDANVDPTTVVVKCRSLQGGTIDYTWTGVDTANITKQSPANYRFTVSDLPVGDWVIEVHGTGTSIALIYTLEGPRIIPAAA